MAEVIKLILEHLNKPPFNKNFNMITFDKLEPLQVLQVLNDVFTYIDDKNRKDLREELPEEMATRMLKFLSLLNYRPEVTLEEFQTGIITGDRFIVQATLYWILPRVEQLKTRAYLGKYLVKIDVPEEILQDDEVEKLHEEYLEYLEQFKEVHKATEALKSHTYTTADLKKDISKMETEYEQIVKNIDRKKVKVESLENLEDMMEAVTELRKEQERQDSFKEQKLSIRASIQTADTQSNRLMHQLRELRSTSGNLTVQTLMQRLEDEYSTIKRMVESTLPHEIEQKKKSCLNKQKVVLEPAMTDDDLRKLQADERTAQSQLQSLLQEKQAREDDDRGDEKLSMFRKQATMIARKKQDMKAALDSAREQLAEAEAEVNEKKMEMKKSGIDRVLTGNEFKAYVAQIKSKGNDYKAKRSQMTELRAEVGVLLRTSDILQAQYDSIKEILMQKEKEKGISGYSDAQDELLKVSEQKGQTDEQKGKVLQDMSDMSNKLNQMIANKKAQLNPIIKELRPLRAEAQELARQHKEIKSTYDRTAAQLGSRIQSLDDEVGSLRKTAQSEQTRTHFLHHSMALLKIQQRRAEDDAEYYRARDPEQRKLSQREQILAKMGEAEALKKDLRDQHKDVADKQAPNRVQMKVWSDLQQILKLKKELLAKQMQQADAEGPKVGADENILIL